MPIWKTLSKTYTKLGSTPQVTTMSGLLPSLLSSTVHQTSALTLPFFRLMYALRVRFVRYLKNTSTAQLTADLITKTIVRQIHAQQMLFVLSHAMQENTKLPLDNARHALRAVKAVESRIMIVFVMTFCAKHVPSMRCVRAASSLQVLTQQIVSVTITTRLIQL